MHILTRKREFLQCLVPHIPSKVSGLFSFGYDTMVGHELMSTRANARLSPHSWATAKSKMWRLLRNERMAALFSKLLQPLALVLNDDMVAVDFSDFGEGRQVLMFAKQTKKGRALPLYFEILEYPIETGSQNLFVIGAIRRFFDAIHCTPTLVFDRGFACPAIVRFLAQNRYTFIIRIKKRKFLSARRCGSTTAAESFKKHDVRAYAYGIPLRLIRSDIPEGGGDPWYLITNDTDSDREAIIDAYYYRFEIEEFFRDAKRLLRLEWVRFKTMQSLNMALWFALLTCWFFEWIAESLTEAQERERQHWRVSRFRYVYESLAREVLHAAQSAAREPPEAV